MTLKKKQILNNNQGATLVEFSLSAILLFMFLILGIDVLRLGYNTSTLQYILGNGAAAGVIRASAERVLVGGRSVMALPDVRIGIIKNEIINLSNRFGMGIAEGPDEYLTVCTDIQNVCRPDAPQSPGNSRDFVRVDFHRKFPFIWGAWNYNINLYVIVKNEPF